MVQKQVTQFLREPIIRHERRDGTGTPMWPERAIGRAPRDNLAEVEAALSRRRRLVSPVISSPAPTARRVYEPSHRVTPPSPPAARHAIPPRQPGNGHQMTFAEAGRLIGITGPAMYKRVRKFGWAVAMIKVKKNNGHVVM